MEAPSTLDLIASAFIMSTTGRCRYNPRPQPNDEGDNCGGPEDPGDHHSCHECGETVHCDRGRLLERVKAFIMIIGVLNAFMAPYVFYGAYVYCLIEYKVEIPLLEPILGFLAVVILGFLGFLPWTGVVLRNMVKGIINNSKDD